MKRISKFLVEHGINSFVLIVVFLLTIFVSNSINTYTTAKLVESNVFQPIKISSQNQTSNENYNDFLAHYYETQSTFLNIWLTIFGILLGFSAIGVPLLLNASYRDKLNDFESEMKRKKINIERLQKDYNNEISKQKHDYDKKMKNFEKDMKKAILEAKTSSILDEIKTLNEEAQRHRDKDEEEQFEKYNKIISLSTSSLSKYKELDDLFYYQIKDYLQNTYYHRGLFYMYDKKDYKKAIKDFNISNDMRPDPTNKQCLLKCYICEGQYKEGIEVVKTIDKINREKLDGRQAGRNFYELLKTANNEDATNLLLRIEEITVD